MFLPTYVIRTYFLPFLGISLYFILFTEVFKFDEAQFVSFSVACAAGFIYKEPLSNPAL
jgi:hypothetical protein